MALSNRMILNLLDALQDKFSPFEQFEDVPEIVLEVEVASEMYVSSEFGTSHDAAV